MARLHKYQKLLLNCYCLIFFIYNKLPFTLLRIPYLQYRNFINYTRGYKYTEFAYLATIIFQINI